MGAFDEQRRASGNICSGRYESYVTISSGGVVEYGLGANEPEFVPLKEWDQSRKVVRKLLNLSVFCKFPLWKVYNAWRRSTHAWRRSNCRLQIAENVIMLEPVFATVLLKVRGTLHDLETHALGPEDTEHQLCVDAFKERQEARLADARVRLEAAYQTVTEDLVEVGSKLIAESGLDDPVAENAAAQDGSAAAAAALAAAAKAPPPKSMKEARAERRAMMQQGGTAYTTYIRSLVLEARQKARTGGVAGLLTMHTDNDQPHPWADAAAGVVFEACAALPAAVVHDARDLHQRSAAVRDCAAAAAPAATSTIATAPPLLLN